MATIVQPTTIDKVFPERVPFLSFRYCTFGRALSNIDLLTNGTDILRYIKYVLLYTDH